MEGKLTRLGVLLLGGPLTYQMEVSNMHQVDKASELIEALPDLEGFLCFQSSLDQNNAQYFFSELFE